MSQSEPVALRHLMEFTTRLALGERMPHVQYWARVRADQDCPLRRGAWYRVVELTPVEAIVDVNHRLLHIPRAFVQVLPLRPPTWTVVPGPDVGAAGPRPRIESARRGVRIASVAGLVYRGGRRRGRGP